MFCTKCGFQNHQGDVFCRQCGRRLEESQDNPSTMNEQQQPRDKDESMNSKEITKVGNQNMKIWAILSVIIPIVALIWYWFIGLSFYMAIIIAAVGFAFAQKGEITNKKLAKLGKVLNAILIGITIIMLVINIILVSIG